MKNQEIYLIMVLNFKLKECIVRKIYIMHFIMDGYIEEKIIHSQKQKKNGLNNKKRSNMPQQTALELVISQLKEEIRKSAHNQLGTNRTGDYRIGLVKAINFCEQAKELEKEQIIRLFKQRLE